MKKLSLACFVVSTLAGCGGPKTPAPATTAATAPAAPPAASTEPAEPAAPAGDDATKPEEPKDKKPAGALKSEPLPKGFTFAWSETPNLAAGPADAIWANAQGRTYKVKHVAFFSEKPRTDKAAKQAWSLKLYEEKPEDTKTKFGPNGASEVTVDIEQVLKAGASVKRAMASGGGYWQIIRKPGDSGTSWNSDTAYALQITKWDVKPWDEKGEKYGQLAGTASGKVVVLYKGFKPEENSWAAGTFTDAVIVYDSKPYWVK